MKIKPGYTIRKVMDVQVIVGIGEAAFTPNQIMSLNETGAFLWDYLAKGAQREELVSALTGEYEVDAGTAGQDVDTFLAALREQGLLDE